MSIIIRIIYRHCLSCVFILCWHSWERSHIASKKSFSWTHCFQITDPLSFWTIFFGWDSFLLITCTVNKQYTYTVNKKYTCTASKQYICTENSQYMVITEGRCICQQNVVPTWLRHQDHGHRGDHQPWRQGQTAYSSETKEIINAK